MTGFAAKLEQERKWGKKEGWYGGVEHFLQK